MRVHVFLAAGILTAGMTPVCFAGSKSPDISAMPEGITFAVVLKTKLDTTKARPGDVVRFDLLSPVMANHSEVVPGNAKVSGKVIEAHPLGERKFSSLAVAIESITWKRHTVPLHAHAIGFGKLRVTYYGKKYNCSQDALATDRPVRLPPQGRGDPPLASNAPIARPIQAQCDSVAAQSETDSESIAHIKLFHTTSELAPVVFGSTKRNIVLQKGALMVVRNGPEPATMGGVSAENKVPQN